MLKSGFESLAQLTGRLQRDISGNATMLVALAMPTLIGGAGMAVDMSQWYMWKRELQYAVDQAAIAGAWALAKDGADSDYQQRALREYDANQSITEGFAARPVVTLANYAGDSANSVVVSVAATRQLPFSAMLTGGATTIVATSQASVVAGGTFTSCMIAIDGEADGAVTIGGNSQFSPGCGIATLSKSAKAVVVNGNPTVDAGRVLAAGGIDDWFDLRTDDEVHENFESLKDPYETLEPPDDPRPRSYGCTTTGKGKDKVTQASMMPGTYSSFVVSCNTSMAPGVYVIDGGDFEVNAKNEVTGNGVMIVLKNGAGLKINGGADIDLTAMDAAQLITAGVPVGQAEKLAGMLVFEDQASPGNKNNKINGNAATILNGTVYLPRSPISFAGTASVTNQCLMLIAATITITGNAKMTSFCPPGMEGGEVVASEQAEVRLVA